VESPPGTAYTPKEFANLETNEVYAVINGGYFNMKTLVSEFLVISDGNLLNSNPTSKIRASKTYFPTLAAFGLFENGTAEAAWVYDVNGTTYAYPIPAPLKNSTPLPAPNETWP
jgi:hypothetical protein